MKNGDSGRPARPHPASFRDPSGRVYEQNGRILRALSPRAAQEFRFLVESGLLNRLVSEGRVVETHEVGVSALELQDECEAPAAILEHQRVPFISYPYEWPFRALQRAALFHLDLQIEALSAGVTLSDATAYNVQFIGTKPVFIDIPSFRKYREGELWLAQRQFCEQFLNPLLLQSLVGVNYNEWYRGALEGIPAGDLARILPLRCKASWLVLAHVLLPNRLQSFARGRATGDLRKNAEGRLSLKAFVAMLQQLRRWIAGLRPKGAKTSVWSAYETTRTYDSEAKSQKLKAVTEFIRETQPGMVWDLGCNAGEYSLEAVNSGANCVIGFDADTGALDEAFRRGEERSAPFLPIYLDAANPSPSQGWRQSERQGFQDRAACDAVLALAFEHHLTIGRNVPIPEFIDWLLGLAPCGLVEFVEKSDPTVQRMLALREDIFNGYSVEEFERLLASRSRILRRTQIANSGRFLFWYVRGERWSR